MRSLRCRRCLLVQEEEEPEDEDEVSSPGDGGAPAELLWLMGRQQGF